MYDAGRVAFHRRSLHALRRTV